MKVPFHLRRLPTGEPAGALLVTSRAVDELLRLCVALGSDARPRIYAVADGFLLELAAPVTGWFPHTVRLRRLVPNLWVPADAELVPSLLDDEARGLVSQRGLVFLPGGRTLVFAPDQPVPLSALVSGGVLHRRAWRSFPAPRPLAARLEEISLELPPQPLENLLGPDAQDIGTEEPRPEPSNLPATALGRVSMGVGRGLMGLGNLLGLRGLAHLGARMVQGAMSIAPRLSEALLGRQEAALRALLRDFREGNLDRALRRALPFGETGERGGVPSSGAHLPENNLAYSLTDILGSGGGPAGYWLGGHDVWTELAEEYRKAARQAARRGDFRRAAYIYGKLLRDYRLAANTLLQGGLAHDAAVLYLTKVGDSLAAARAFEAAGEVDRAVALYRRRGDHLQAADLLRRAGEEEAALVEYQLAANQLADARQDYYAAGDLLLTRAGRGDLALPYFQAGWSRRLGGNALPNIVPCAQRLATLYAQDEAPAKLLTLVAEADAFFTQTGGEVEAGKFYNHLAILADRENLVAVRDELRDRALLGIAAKLRRRAEVETRPGTVVGTLLGRCPAWSAPLVNDAQLAWKRALKRPPASSAEPATRMVQRLAIAEGTVTAAAAASRTGEVFLGFESGEIYCFRPSTGEVLRLSMEPLPVIALAVAPAANLVAVLREGEANVFLASYLLTPTGLYRAIENRALEEPGASWLTPVLVVENHAAYPHPYVVGLGTGENLTFLWGPTLAPGDNLLSSFSQPDLTTGLLLPAPPGQGEPGLAVLLFHGEEVWYSAMSRPGILEGSLGWRPAIPEGNSLRSIPLAWLHTDPEHLEIVGLDGHGFLRYSALEWGNDRFERIATNVWAPGQHCLAATLLRAGRAASVKTSQIDWLRCSANGVALWSRTTVYLPSAVACFPSDATNELIVVCKEGVVYRVPVPN